MRLAALFLCGCAASPWAAAEFREGEAVVTIREGAAPPIRIGEWTCEVAAWGTPTVALLRCPDVEGREQTLELVARLAEADGVVEATPNLIRRR